ncbi:MAG: AAA family ATPase [Bacteroidia bacterium]|nr:AAA family ATPase [Bacteroidia bacterium]
MMHNNLYINRLVILSNEGKVAYDEKYHKGVNIIRGENSSGKSTISHFIFYVLGGAFHEWVKEARKCNCVFAETELNGATVTLKRHLTFNEQGRANDKEGIYFFWGPYEDAKKAVEGWLYFGYNSTSDKKSFSNVIFENLNIPVVKGDNNITIHQLLRLIYVDQDSPTSSLFLYEQFDTTLTRETVAELLLGVYNQELYDKKQRALEVSSELETTRTEIKVIKKFTPDPYHLIPANIKTQIEQKEKEIEEVDNEIVALSTKAKQVRYAKSTKLEFEKLNEEAIAQRKKIKELANDLSKLTLEVADTELFIDALENKKRAVSSSISTRELLGAFELDFCPECLSEIPKIDNKEICKLCKTPVQDSIGVTKARKIEQEISFQIKESKKIVEQRKRSELELKSTFDSEQIKLHQIQEKVNQALNDVSSYREEKINSLYTGRGFIDGEIIQLRTLLENAELYERLIKKQSELEQEQDALDYSIKILIQQQEKLKKDINVATEGKGIYLLNNDLKRQDEFFEAKEFHIDYRNNIAFIADKEAKYSASSSFYLKTSARYAIFFASLEIERMRFPRFILCDNMEDKGIEKERAQNFQRIIVKEAETHSENSYQVIYTTSFIPDELNNEKYCVGEFYTEQSRSLKNV